MSRASRSGRGKESRAHLARLRGQQGAPAAPGPASAAAEAFAEKLEQRVQAQQEAQTRPDGRERLRAAQGQSAQVRQELARQESAWRERGPELRRELGAEQASAPAQGWLARLRQGVAKTRASLAEGLAGLVAGHARVEPSLLDGLEELLLAADVGPVTTGRLMRALKERVRRQDLGDATRLRAALAEEVAHVLHRPYGPPAWEAALAAGEPLSQPVVLLLVGVNGTGKTTTLGKLAALYQGQGRRVLLAAGDTFRAAAAEQLEGWAGRVGCDIFRKPAGTEPSAVLYQATQQALAGKYDVLLCDTAGRLHTKVNLMEELKKVKRVLAKLIPSAPHETWLVLDANTGQNAIHQARDFHQALGLTGLIVTKLDGTARGGVLIGIVNEFDIPVRYIGVGEGVADLQPFDPDQFAASLFDERG